jgi:para-nitrobenzyl esterase
MQSKSVNDLMKSVADWLNPNWPFSTSDLSRQQVRSHFKSTLGIDSPVAGGYLPALAPIMPWGATVDGSSDGLLVVPLASIKQGDFARVPTIFGTNMNEGSIFIPMLPLVKKGAHFPPTDQDLVSVLAQVFEMYTPSAVQKVIPDIMTQYPTSNYGGDEWARASDLLTHYFFRCGVRRSARAIAQWQPDIFQYRFQHHMDFIENDILKDLGNYHTSELYFVWDNAWPPLIHIFSSDDQNMADIITDYWSSLAYSGDPSAATAPLGWPRYNASSDTTLALHVPPTLLVGMDKAICDFWDGVQQTLQGTA